MHQQNGGAVSSREDRFNNWKRTDAIQFWNQKIQGSMVPKIPLCVQKCCPGWLMLVWWFMGRGGQRNKKDDHQREQHEAVGETTQVDSANHW